MEEIWQRNLRVNFSLKKLLTLKEINIILFFFNFLYNNRPTAGCLPVAVFFCLQGSLFNDRGRDGDIVIFMTERINVPSVPSC